MDEDETPTPDPPARRSRFSGQPWWWWLCAAIVAVGVVGSAILVTI